MDLIISRLTPRDADRAFAHCALFWDMKTATEDLAAYLSDPNCILLTAEIAGHPVGQILGYILRRWDSRKPQLFLYSIDVVAAHRRKGIGRQLVNEFRRLGREAGCESAFVITNESNAPAMQFYRALGGNRPNPDDVIFEWI